MINRRTLQVVDLPATRSFVAVFMDGNAYILAPVVGWRLVEEWESDRPGGDPLDNPSREIVPLTECAYGAYLESPDAAANFLGIAPDEEVAMEMVQGERARLKNAKA